MPMNIGIDVRAVGKRLTGDEVYVSNMILNLAKIDTFSNYFLFTNISNPLTLPLLKDLPANFRVISILPANKFIWTMFLLPLYAIKYNLDILHVLYITPIFLPRRIRLITTIHDMSWKMLPQHVKKIDRISLNILIPLSVRRANKIITISDNSRNDIINLLSVRKREKVKTIYIGGYINENKLIMPSFEKIGIDAAKSNYILYMGTLQPRKNIPALIEAYMELYKEYAVNLGDNFPKLVIAGARGYNYDFNIDKTMDKIDKFDKNKYILLPGYISDENKYTLLKNASIFVYPSLYEGFGIPPIEAMSLGVPTIVSDKSCLPEIVGDGACVLDTKNKKVFAVELYDILTNKERIQNMVRKGMLRAKQFTWENMAINTLKIYEEIITSGDI